MQVDGQSLRSIRIDGEHGKVWVLDQRLLPHKLKEIELYTLDEVIDAIQQMIVRGAPLIGVTAAAGLALACNSEISTDFIELAAAKLIAARPTAVNLYYAVNRAKNAILKVPLVRRRQMAWTMAERILVEELGRSYNIGQVGVSLIQELYKKKKRPLTILTHCNAGWLATVDYGTATAPIYAAWEQRIPIRVLADETRPRLQGTLTAWELSKHGIPVKLISDNAGGLLLRQGKVDLVITGADRIASNGDTANKIGTYLKALAAADNNVPFYIAAPESTFDWSIETGADIPIEERDGNEIRSINGIDSCGNLVEVRITNPEMEVVNPGFDITPGRLITGFITEHGIFKVSELPHLKELHAKQPREKAVQTEQGPA